MESLFDKYAREGNEFLKELAFELNHEDDYAMAGRKLKAVLHTLRNYLTVEEAAQMLAQLPMFMKAVFVDKWSFRHKVKPAKNLNDFYKEIQKIG